jgi:hypothetical protein
MAPPTRRRCQETDFDFFPKRLPAEGTTAAFDFAEIGTFRWRLGDQN